MAALWSTRYALENMPVVAERMNNLPKVVFSRTLREALWNNTKLVKGDITAEIRELKKEPWEDMAILKSGSIVSQFAQEG
jgi:dihydrofolate reductase